MTIEELQQENLRMRALLVHQGYERHAYAATLEAILGTARAMALAPPEQLHAMRFQIVGLGTEMQAKVIRGEAANRAAYPAEFALLAVNEKSDPQADADKPQARPQTARPAKPSRPLSRSERKQLWRAAKALKKIEREMKKQAGETPPMPDNVTTFPGVVREDV